MSSEAIVVLVLIAIAVGFVVWVRMNSHGHDAGSQAGDPGEQADKAGDRK
jgi:hypothetical protein